MTTGYEWYVFDAVDFHRLFWKNTALMQAYRDFKGKGKVSTDTDFFYKSIAGKAIAALSGELRVAYVDLRPGPPTRQAERSPDVRAEFAQVPYLNSSLFEPSQLEGLTLDISGLRDGLGLAPLPGPVRMGS